MLHGAAAATGAEERTFPCVGPHDDRRGHPSKSFASSQNKAYC